MVPSMAMSWRVGTERMDESHVYLNPHSVLLSCHASGPSFDSLGYDGGCGCLKDLHLHPLILVDRSCCGIENLRFFGL